MAKRRWAMNQQVRKNLKRDTTGIEDSTIDTWLEWSQQRVADLHTFEEMRTRIYDPIIEDCEDAWLAKTNVTCTADSTYEKRGTYCAKMVIAAAFDTGIAATEVITSTDFTEYTHLMFWIRCDAATTAGQLQILLDDTAACASASETLDVPALTADTWKECTVKLSTPTTDTAIISIGLNVATAFTPETTVYIDEVRKVRCTAKDIARYSPPTDTKNILSITVQDGSSSRKLTAIYHRLFDQLRPRLRETSSTTPTHYIDYGSYFELYPMPDDVYPMHIRYSKYPTAFSETSTVIEDCEDAWVAKTNVTSTADTAYVKLGTYSAKHVIAAGHTTGLASTEDFTAVDLSSYTHLKLWMRTTVAVNEGDLQMVIDDTAACASPLETLDVPAMMANKWYEHTLKFVTPANLTAILSVGLNVAVDGGAMTVYIDDVRAVYTSVSGLLRKDQVIEAGATVYGFQFLRQHDEATKWNTIFVQMMKQVAGTDKSHEDLLQVARGFGAERVGLPAGDPWAYPHMGV